VTLSALIEWTIFFAIHITQAFLMALFGLHPVPKTPSLVF
jgi:hypothetical protein